MQLRDKVAVITGSSLGIGSAIALAFAKEGAAVAVDYRSRPDEAKEIVDQVEGSGGRAISVRADVSSPEDVKNLIQEAVSEFGRLDVMVNNAGISGRYSKPLLETSEDDWDAIMAVNLRGVFLCCKRAIGEMLGQEPRNEIRGRVVNISSQHGMIGPPGHVAYATSKGGVVNLTRQLAVDYGPRGVLVNAVAPGKILTGSPEQQDPEALAYSHARTPFFRLGQPEDVAAAALFLASDDAAYVSGINLLVDGGWMAY